MVTCIMTKLYLHCQGNVRSSVSVFQADQLSQAELQFDVELQWKCFLFYCLHLSNKLSKTHVLQGVFINQLKLKTCLNFMLRGMNRACMCGLLVPLLCKPFFGLVYAHQFKVRPGSRRLVFNACNISFATVSGLTFNTKNFVETYDEPGTTFEIDKRP